MGRIAGGRLSASKGRKQLVSPGLPCPFILPLLQPSALSVSVQAADSVVLARLKQKERVNKSPREPEHRISVSTVHTGDGREHPGAVYRVPINATKQKTEK